MSSSQCSSIASARLLLVLLLASSIALALGCDFPKLAGTSSATANKSGSTLPAPGAAGTVTADGTMPDAGGVAADVQSRPSVGAIVWATDEEHAELRRVVQPIVQPYVGPARPWGGVPGIALGIIRGGKQYFFGFGESRPGQPVERKTIFEIGSLTKTFTGLLLADAVLKGKVGLDDVANTHLPARLRLPSRNGKEITLRHLATHRSGLPDGTRSMMTDAIGMVMGNPQPMSISMSDLETWLTTATLDNDPGEAWVYSNLGSSFLAFALETVEGRPWEDLVADLITSPLEMTETRVMDGTPIPEKALGYDLLTREVSTDSLTKDSAVAAAGALRSNIEDMLRYAAIHARATASPLDPAAAFAQRAHGDGLGAESPMSFLVPKFKSGLLLERKGDGDVPDVGSKNGAMVAFMSDMQFAPAKGIATVALSNRFVIDLRDPYGPITAMNEAVLAAIRDL
jgi:CubicO group peptidase (beta-lactamase class C family)